MSTDAEYNERRQREWEEWRANTAFHPISDFSDIAMQPDVELPANGSYYIIANDLQEIKDFLSKINRLDRWMSTHIIEDPWADVFDLDEEEEEEEKEEVDCSYEERAIRTLRINQYYPVNEQLQVHRTTTERCIFPITFTKEFLDEVTFPCLVQNSGESDSDRIGDYEINHCQVLNLTGCPMREGPVKIHLRWI